MAKSKQHKDYSFQVNNPLMIRETSYQQARTICKTPSDAYEICKDMLDQAQESFQCLTMNARNYIIDRHLVTLGIVDATLIHPREIFKLAIKDGASTIIIVHNHPSGDPSPSAEDIKITRQLVEAGKIIGIKIIDHIVIGKPHDPYTKTWLSIRESGLLSFE